MTCRGSDDDDDDVGDDWLAKPSHSSGHWWRGGEGSFLMVLMLVNDRGSDGSDDDDVGDDWLAVLKEAGQTVTQLSALMGRVGMMMMMVGGGGE